MCQTLWERQLSSVYLFVPRNLPFRMEALQYLRYMPEILGFITTFAKTTQALGQGNPTEAVHAASGFVRPIMVAAAGKSAGDKYDSMLVGGLASAGAGVVFDAAVSVTTQKNYGVVKHVADDGYLSASMSTLADFGHGVAVSISNNKNNQEQSDETEKISVEEAENDEECVIINIDGQ